MAVGTEFGTRSYFGAADYVVCGAMLAASLAIGIYYGFTGNRQRTSAEFILANRQMTFLPVTLSLLASFVSGITVQGVPADVYYHGPILIWHLVSEFMGGILAITFFMPLYYTLGLISVYEYLGLRFNSIVRICGVISFLLYTTLYLAVITYTACVAATAVTGISLEVAVVGVCVVCAIYTVLGGIKAVLWTDSLQIVLIAVAVVVILIKGAVDMGGFGNIWKIATDGGRTNFFEFSTDLTQFYNGLGFTFGQITYANFLINNQYMVQRFVVCKSQAVARAAIVCYLVGMFVIIFVLIFLGFTLYAHYDGCDPGTMGYTTRNDQILPYYIVDVFAHLPAVPGLLLTGLFGAALSTMSSVLNASAVLVGEYVVKPLWKGLEDSTYTHVLKLLVVVFSLTTLGLAFVVPHVGDVIPVMVTLNGCSQGTVLALYLLGGYFPFVGSKGAVSGFVVGLVLAITFTVGSIVYPSPVPNLPLSADVCLNDTVMAAEVDNVTMVTYRHESPVTYQMTTLAGVNATADPGYMGSSETPTFFKLSKIWYATLTFVVTMIVALFATLVTGKNDTSQMDPRLVFWKIKSSYTPVSKESVEDYSGNESNGSQTGFKKPVTGTSKV